VHARALAVPDAWEFQPKLFSDDRGIFLEWFKADVFAAATGRALTVVQANQSVSRKGVLRGLHFADVPPGQGKYIACPRGAVLDVIVDIRAGSPTFGAVDAVRLDEVDRRTVFASEGLGHAFMALTDDAVVTYLITAAYNPAAEHEVNPLDPDLRMPWPADIEPVLSAKDAAAPTLAEALEQGLLPQYDACQVRYAELRLDRR